MMYYYNGFYPSPISGFGFLFGVLSWVLVVIVIVTIIRLIVGRRHGWRHGWGCHCHDGGDAAEILRQRYAKGELTKDQFEQMKKDLEK